MFASSSVAAALLLLAPTAARADDTVAKTAREAVARAIKATGGPDDGKPLRLSWKDNGTLYLGEMKLAYTADWRYRGPDAMRVDLAMEVMGMNIKLLRVINGDKVWEVFNDKAGAVESGDKYDAARAMTYQLGVVTLSRLTHDKEFKLSTVVGKKVNDRPTVGVLVERKDRPVVTLYFDEGTGLLVKSEMTVKDEFRGWQEALDEAYYEDYKDVGGRKVFSAVRVIRDGRVVVESKMSDVALPDSLDAKLFEKP